MEQNAKQATAGAFKATSLQMLEYAATVWPADPLLRVAHNALESQADTDIIEAFIQRFGSVQDQLSQHSTSALDTVSHDPIVAPLQVLDKWASANDEERESLWTHMDHLCRFATIYGMYTQIPDTVMDIINGTALNLKSQIESGSLDLSNVNPMDLGQQILGKISPEQMQSMMTVMMANQDKMMSLMTGLGGSTEGPDLTSILGMLSK